MSQYIEDIRSDTANPISDSARDVTSALLMGGLLAGPIYVVVGLAEALVRPGFDLRRHELSLLANGDLGWIHVAMMLVTGLLACAGAMGLRRALPPGPGRTGGPILLGVYGLGVALAGLLTADPASGFPPGTPDSRALVLSWHGIGHLVAGSIGFLGLIAACFVFARRFGSNRNHGWAAYSTVTGVVFLAGFVGIASGTESPALNMAFGVAVVVAWAWISVLCAWARARYRENAVEKLSAGQA